MAYETYRKPYGSKMAELKFELKGALEGEGCRSPKGALASVARLVVDLKVAGLIPGQGTYPGCGSVPSWGACKKATDGCFSLVSPSPSLCLSLSLSVCLSVSSLLPPFLCH